ncbi:hypothetical protein TCA2_4551 [Paenibacillus sp. TCA20]|uniref:hypothetical protein n=1 Tax=Paenibacillus sp. TCA20 TaxID=1499968 RepID=UPI0004DAB87A|nr:hypothetical protein [Paenibacillus sp. TCA20]GAK42059.1 hypothetical protein TCA2_4551 [Paenibacillus sp. TCA20]
MQNWMIKLEELMMSSDQNIDEMVEQSSHAKNADVGIINDTSGAGILARDSGVLEGFSYYNLGFRLDPSTMTFGLYAPKIRMFTDDFKVVSGAQEFNPINDEYEEILNMIGGNNNGQV